MNLSTARAVVTGGSGFLGRRVVAGPKSRGCTSITVPRSATYDLRERAAARNLYRDTQPDLVIHLAAVVGGIGASRAHPGRFFYDNVVMGIETLEQARLAGVAKYVGVGTICSYPKITPVPFHEDDPESSHVIPALITKMTEAILLACEKYDGAEPVNVGSVWDATKPNGQPRRSLDTSRAEKAFGVRARTAFAAGLSETVAWYRAGRTKRA